VAAFCAAETQDEKKPPPGVTFRDSLFFTAGVLASSIVGVNGARTEFDNLLGWWVKDDCDLARRCDIILPDGLTTTSGVSFDSCGTVVFLRGDSGGVYDLFSVGVGGVTVVEGVVTEPGGV
jgi:hypothetical protein